MCGNRSSNSLNRPTMHMELAGSSTTKGQDLTWATEPSGQIQIAQLPNRCRITDVEIASPPVYRIGHWNPQDRPVTNWMTQRQAH